MSRVSLGAELVFAKLILAADDYGRLDARPAALKATLFPVRDSMTPGKLLPFVRELAAEGCVQLYESGGRPYLALSHWEKHRGKSNRAQTSKCPEPPPGDPGDSRISARSTLGVERRTLGEVDEPTPPKQKATLFPEGGLTLEQKRQLAASPSLKDIKPSQFQHACAVVADWSASNQKTRVDWVATVRGAINRGWALEGYGGSGNGKAVGRGNTNYSQPRESSNWAAIVDGPQGSEDGAGETNGGKVSPDSGGAT